MTITKRTLERWRKEALCETDIVTVRDQDGTNPHTILIEKLGELSNRILRLTQVLLDQHLIRRKS